MMLTWRRKTLPHKQEVPHKQRNLLRHTFTSHRDVGDLISLRYTDTWWWSREQRQHRYKDVLNTSNNMAEHPKCCDIVTIVIQNIAVWTDSITATLLTLLTLLFPLFLLLKLCTTRTTTSTSAAAPSAVSSPSRSSLTLLGGDVTTPRTRLSFRPSARRISKMWISSFSSWEPESLNTQKHCWLKHLVHRQSSTLWTRVAPCWWSISILAPYVGARVQNYNFSFLWKKYCVSRSTKYCVT